MISRLKGTKTRWFQGKFGRGISPSSSTEGEVFSRLEGGAGGRTLTGGLRKGGACGQSGKTQGGETKDLRKEKEPKERQNSSREGRSERRNEVKSDSGRKEESLCKTYCASAGPCPRDRHKRGKGAETGHN